MGSRWGSNGSLLQAQKRKCAAGSRQQAQAAGSRQGSCSLHSLFADSAAPKNRNSSPTSGELLLAGKMEEK